MPLRDVNIGESLGLHRGDMVVCVVLRAGDERFADCLRNLLKHTDADVPLLFCDPSPDRPFRALIEERVAAPPNDRAAHYLACAVQPGPADVLNAAVAATAPADVVILGGDVLVAEGWSASLREAAYSESRVASATALTNDGTLLSIPHRNESLDQLPEGETVEGAAASVRATSLRLWPDIPMCLGHCAYIRRSALELVGAFDTSFSEADEIEADFSQKCIVHGLRHVAADDVFVFRLAPEAEDESVREPVSKQRYGYLERWVHEVGGSWDSPLARALSIAAYALRSVTVTIDGRCLGPTVTGTQLVTLGVIGALDSHTDLYLRVLIPENFGAWAEAFLAQHPRVGLMRRGEVTWTPPTDIVHRPYQVASHEDVGLLARLGHRLVLTQLDNIALRNPGYFPGYDEWTEYRELNRAALAAADQVVFISYDSATDARRLGLVHPDRINVVSPATDLPSLGFDDSVRPPDYAAQLTSRPFLLCLGTDFLHKNRIFAMRLLEALGEQGFDGTLLFAGPKVAAGSSGEEEAEYLSSHPELRARVRDIGEVQEPVKRWLLGHAAAVVYPTTSEGFGLTPFEAADAGTPCLFASHTSLAEILPSSAALLVPWDPEESARRAIRVLRAGEERERHVRTIRVAGSRFTSAKNAQGLADVYTKALRSPATASTGTGDGQPGRERAEAESLRRELSVIYDDPLNRGLVGPEAVLPPELRRAVLAVSTRPLMRKSALALYRAGYAMLHGFGRHPDDGQEADR